MYYKLSANLDFFWLFIAVILESGSFFYFIGIFWINMNFWADWCLFFLFGSSIFQTVDMGSAIIDSFEQLLNQFVPVNQQWFSSDRARPRFRAGAVRPKLRTSSQRGAALKGQYARILANFRSRRLRKFSPVGRAVQPVLSLDILKSPVVAPIRNRYLGWWVSWIPMCYQNSQTKNLVYAW